ncbi:DAK2 domain protein [Corynebacterium occultum]|uniref:DAK2 domain protein n=1 Tax=Corynebacterium occultum TaxID=2675219 RepID=A0A6B8VSS9_9CORY|nr:DAK2 domain-containing protein [Corynebacterium occultum]QGU07213.1 DAK2 domain protein [Corynebacterium occultum]
MSYPTELDGPRMRNWAVRAVAELSARRAEINALNVFPVPDADTGSNMTHTMEAALREVEKLDEKEAKDAVRVAEALAVGSVRGARGNSGVVLSQVLRAVAQAAVDGRVDGASISQSLSIAVQLVDTAISDPVEGTVITVLRASAIAARDIGGELHEVVAAAVHAARIALAKTPSQLDVLREAGVVDAGGQGFVVIMETLLAEIEGGTIRELPIGVESHGKVIPIEVMFYFSGPKLDELEQELHDLGDSLLIARDSDIGGTVHIHSSQPGAVIEQAYAMGAVSELRLEVLPEAPQVAPPTRVVVAITPRGSIAQLYRESGALVVSPGGDVVSEIIAAVRRSGAEEVILLPNGLLNRREMVSVEKASHAFEQTITLLPTGRLVSGIAALSVHDPEEPLGVAAYAMAEAAGAMRTAILRRAEKAALTQVGPCARGDILATTQLGEIILVAEDLIDALLGTCRRLLEAGGEQVTLLASPKVIGKLKGEEIVKNLGRTGVGVEVMIYPAEGMEHLIEIGVE